MIRVRSAAATILAAAVSFCLAGSVAAQCRVGLVAELPIVMDGNQPLLKGEINGRPMLALVDTGAFNSLVWRGAAERYGLPVRPLRGITIVGVGGAREAQATSVKELKLGGQSRRDLSLLMTGSNRPLGRSGAAMIIGQDILSSSDVEFDFANKVMRLLRPVGCGPKDSLAYWGRDYAVAPIERVSREEPDIRTTVLLNGRRTRAILDTGAYSTVVTEQAAARAGVKLGDKGVEEAGRSGGVGARTVASYVARFDSFQLGEQIVSKPRLRIADLFRHARSRSTGSRLARGADDTPEMLIGADFFRAHRVLISYSQRAIYFTHNGGPIFQVEGPLLAPERDDAPAEAPGSAAR